MTSITKTPKLGTSNASTPNPGTPNPGKLNPGTTYPGTLDLRTINFRTSNTNNVIPGHLILGQSYDPKKSLLCVDRFSWKFWMSVIMKITLKG